MSLLDGEAMDAEHIAILLWQKEIGYAHLYSKTETSSAAGVTQHDSDK
jgi:hypothetical protein